MKTLLLLRHAKSSWADPAIGDFDRPLAPRGRRAMKLIGGYLEDRKLLPDLVLCSTAKRTHETCDLLAPQLGGASVRFDKALYLSTPAVLLRLVQAAPLAAGRVMVIAHNPGLQQFAERLAGSGDEVKLERMHSKFPTAGLAVLTLPIDDWRDVTAAGARLEDFVAPRDLD